MSEYLDCFREVQAFKNEHKRAFLDVLKGLKHWISEVRNDVNMDVIQDFYTRGDKNGGDELKSDSQTVLKLISWRLEDPNIGPQHLHDLLGGTIVVLYEDEVNDLVKILLESLENEGSEFRLYQSNYPGFENPQKKSKFGYYATHLILESARLNSNEFLFELQIKTLMHSAWSIKTHDLTYKPRLLLDPSTKRLMESIGDSIKSIEVQSELLRKLITQQQKALDVSRSRTHELLSEGLTGLLACCPEANALVAKLNCESDRIRNLKSETLELRTYIREINTIKSNIKLTLQDDSAEQREIEIRASNVMLVYFALLRSRTDLDSIAGKAIKDCGDEISKRGMVIGASYWTASLHYMLGNVLSALEILTAIEMKSELIGHPLEFTIVNNLACYLSEAYLDKPSDLATYPERVFALKLRLKELISSKDDDNNSSVFDSTSSIIDIVFGIDEKEIRRGLLGLMTAYQDKEAPQFFEAISETYERVALLRLTELGDQRDRS